MPHPTHAAAPQDRFSIRALDCARVVFCRGRPKAKAEPPQGRRPCPLSRYSPASLRNWILELRMRFPIWAVAAALVLAGCSSPNDLLKKDPAFFGHTSKSAQAYAQCVADSWRRQGEQV